VLSDWELWACANHYVEKHGPNAAVIAAMRADELLAEQDHDGVRNFTAIIARINTLLNGPTGLVH
jgi:hypothetical protein